MHVDGHPAVHPAHTNSHKRRGWKQGFFDANNTVSWQRRRMHNEVSFIASLGFLPNNRVSSPFGAASTSGKALTHSADLSEDLRAANNNSCAYCAPKSRSASVRLKRSTMPCSRWEPTRPRRTCTLRLASSWIYSTHEFTPRINLQKVRPSQGTTLVHGVSQKLCKIVSVRTSSNFYKF